MTQQRPSGKVTYDNHGRCVVVTGGCSGIGLAVVAAFNDTGADVIAADIDREAAKQLPVGVHFEAVDTSDEEQCAAVVASAVDKFGGVDVLVNNAAIQPKASYIPVTEVDDEQLRRMTEVNFYGYHYMAKHALQQMLKQESGVVVNMASGQGHRTTRQVPVYGPIKAATILQSMQWGVEFARHGIRVVSVSPGAVDTPMVRASLEKQGGVDELANRHPVGRIGKPEEVAAAVLWLSSPDASFITATDLQVDGGLGAFGAFADPFPQSDV